MQNEIEARFVFEDKDQLRAMLKELGFEIVQPECLMRRCVYNIPSRGKEYYARVRDEGNRITATVKCVSSNTIDGVKEAEVQVSDFDSAHSMFEMMGMQKKAYQETKRELWRKDDTEMMIDTWPGLPPFVEIESTAEEHVRHYADKLGFNWEDASFGAIDDLYTKYLGWAADEINAHPEITFSNPPKSK